MEMINAKCPQCGANLKLHCVYGQAVAFCEYCGGKILLNDKQKTCDVNNGVIVNENNDIITAEESKKHDGISISFFKYRILLYVVLIIFGVYMDGTYPDSSYSVIWAIGIMIIIYGSIGHGIALFLSSRKKKRSYNINNTTVINNETRIGYTQQEKQVESSNFCSNCGARLKMKAKYCSNCGCKTV